MHFKNSHGNYIVVMENHGIVFFNFCGNRVNVMVTALKMARNSQRKNESLSYSAFYIHFILKNFTFFFFQKIHKS